MQSTQSSLLSNLSAFCVLTAFRDLCGKVEMDIKLGKYRAMPTGEFESRKVVKQNDKELKKKIRMMERK